MMDRIKILMLFCLLPIIASAQFHLTPEGMMSADDKPYIVESIKGSQKQLYQRTKTVLTSLLKTDKYEMKFNEPDIIIISCEGLKIAKDYVAGLKDSYSTKWTIEIKFKPNKIRIDAPVIEPLKCRRSIIKLGKGSALGVASGLNREGHLFKDDGTAREEAMVTQLEDYFNKRISQIIKDVKEYDTSENNKW